MALTNSEVFSVIHGSCRMDVEEGWKLIKVDDGFGELTGYTKERVFKERVVYSQLVHKDDVADFFQRLFQFRSIFLRFLLRFCSDDLRLWNFHGRNQQQFRFQLLQLFRKLLFFLR